MIELRDALQTLFQADTLTSTLLLAADSTTLINIPAADIANWRRRDVVWFETADGSNYRTRRIVDVDSGANTVTLHRALPTTIQIGDKMHGGLTEWLRSGPLVKYMRPAFSTPVNELKNDTSDPLGALIFGSLDRIPIFASADGEPLEVRGIAPYSTFAEGIAHRARRLLHRKRTAITIADGYVDSITAGSVTERTRKDDLFEYLVGVEIKHAEVTV